MSDIQGYKLYKEGNFEGAIHLFEAHILKDAEDVKAIYHLAISYRRLNDHIKSVQLLDRCCKISPEDMDLLSERGVGKFHLNDKPGALEDLNTCAEKEPKKAYRYTSRAYIKANMNDNIGALEDYEIAIKLDPTDPIALNNMGLIEEKAGKMAAAKKRFKLSDDLAGIENKRQEKIESQDSYGDKEQMANVAGTDSAKKETKTPKNKKLTFKNYIETLKYALGSKEGRKEFMSFISGKHKSNSDNTPS